MKIVILTSNHYLKNILVTKTTAAQNEVALSYHKVRGLYFLAIVFVSSIVNLSLVSLFFYYIDVVYYSPRNFCFNLELNSGNLIPSLQVRPRGPKTHTKS